MNDDTAELYRVTRTPEPVADEAEADKAAALMAELTEPIEWVERLMSGRADFIVRTQLQAELRKLVAAAQALDGHLAEADRAGQDSATESQFLDWLHAPGGEQR